MKGIPAELHFETLNRTLEKMPAPTNLAFSNLFPSVQYESDRIRWMMEYGTAGMAPFAAPGTPAEVMGDSGFYSEGAAAAAYWKEKVFLGEDILNNLRDPVTPTQRITAQRQLAKKEAKLKNRNARRKEWMIAKAFFDNTITYQREGGTKFTVNYGIPTHHQVTLTGNNVWWVDGTGAPGSTAKPVKDIYDMKDLAAADGLTITDSFMNSTCLKYLLFNADLQTLLQKSTFGDGDLFARPAQVLSNLLGLGGLTIYDEIYEVASWATQDVAVGQATIYVEDATDFEAAQTVRIYNRTTHFEYTEYTISSVSISANSITLTSNLTTAVKSGRDQVVMRKKFITDAKVGFFTREVEGERIAEFMEAPFGMGRYYGMFADSKEEWDPDGVWIRVQNKGLPVIYHPDGIWTLTIK